MVKQDYVHGAYHKNLANEIQRVLLECGKIGILMNKKLATALIAEKSKRGMMTKKEIEEYLKELGGTD